LKYTVLDDAHALKAMTIGMVSVFNELRILQGLGIKGIIKPPLIKTVTVNIFKKPRSIFKAISNQGAARLRIVLVIIKAIIKPPSNQGDDCWHF
jgi:hypothetical protein